jgi:hypothetical protein
MVSRREGERRREKEKEKEVGGGSPLEAWKGVVPGKQQKKKVKGGGGNLERRDFILGWNTEQDLKPLRVGVLDVVSLI